MYKQQQNSYIAGFRLNQTTKKSFSQTMPFRKSTNKDDRNIVYRKLDSKSVIKVKKLAYLYSVDKNLLSKLNPVVHGPSAIIVDSIKSHNKQHFSVAQGALARRLEYKLGPMMEQYCDSIGLQRGRRIFVMNSRDQHVKLALQELGWQQNLKNDSVFFHLKWHFKDCAEDYANLLPGQLFNHFPNNHQLTEKNLLNANLKKILSQKELGLTVPPTFTAVDVGAQYENYQDTIALSQFLLKSQKKVSEARQKDCDYIELLLDGRLKKLMPLVKDNRVEIQLVQSMKEKYRELKCKWPRIRTFGNGNLWVIKPCGKSRGVGIRIVKGLTLSQPQGDRIIQKYVEHPLILHKFQNPYFNNKKFDIRQWVLVRSFIPLEAYRYSQCYLRFCSKKYDLSSIGQPHAHLTNYSQNKKSFEDPANSVMMLQQFQKQLLVQKGIDYQQKVTPFVDKIIMRSLQAAQQKISTAPAGCFQLYGFDILLDADCYPWLLQVNKSPACEGRCEQLRRMSLQMARQTIALLSSRPAPNWIPIKFDR